jgi:hypothetical protein
MPSNGERRKPLFSPEKEDEIMAQVVGRPSGTVVELGGQAIDLIAIPFAKERRVIALAQSFGDLFREAKTQSQAGDGAAESSTESSAPFNQRVQASFDELKAYLKEVVHDSVEIAPDGERVFEAWWGQLPMGPTMRTLLNALLQANGVGELGNALGAAMTTMLEMAPQRMAVAAASLSAAQQN